MKIAIGTDTNSGITRDMIRRPGLYLLPMPVIVEGTLYAEGVDITGPQLYRAMKEHKEISSSQPAPGRVLEFWDSILAEGYDQIVYIPMSSGLSGSCSTAMQLALEYGGKVQVVDNHRISVTQAESVFTACRLAEQGYSGEEIKAHLEERAYDASIYITVDSMEYLKRGGRITPAVAAFAAVLNLKPVMTIQGDKLDAYGKVRGMRQARVKMIEAVRKDRATRFGEVPDELLQVGAAGSFEEEAQAQAWLREVQEAFAPMPVFYAPLPCSIACHVGRNAAGVGIIKKATR